LGRKAPSGIAASFRGSTNVATLIPRVFQEDDKADNEVLQPLIQEIAVYPLSEFDGKVKTRDWSSLPSLPWIKLGEEEWKWVDPATFFDILPEVLDAARPLPGEEALYALVRSVLDAAAVDKTLRKGLAYTTRYAIVGANALGLPVILDGINDQGLSVGLFYFPGVAS